MEFNKYVMEFNQSFCCCYFNQLFAWETEIYLRKWYEYFGLSYSTDITNVSVNTNNFINIPTNLAIHTV